MPSPSFSGLTNVPRPIVIAYAIAGGFLLAALLAGLS